MTLPEIAKAALPGLPSSRQGLEKRADTEGWAQRNGLCRKRKGSGGGMEYSVDLLPLEARQALVERAGVFSSDIEPSRTWTNGDPLSREERDRSDAKLHVLSLFDAFRLAKDLSHRDARQVFPLAWNSGSVTAPDWVRTYVPSLSKKSLDNWPKIRREQGDDALGLDQRGRPGRIDSAADGQARMRLTALIAANEFLTGEQIKDYMRENFDDELGDVSTRTVQRTRARIEKEDRNVLMRMRDPDAWRSKVEISGTAMITAAGLNDLWEMDASPADVMLRGKRRHSIYMSVDVWTRRTIITVTQTPRASAVAALTRKCLIEWGIRKLLEQVRDIHDIAQANTVRGAGANIILVGEEELPTELSRTERFHGRIFDSIPALEAAIEDVDALAPRYAAGVEIEEELKEALLVASRHSIRRVCSNLAAIKECSQVEGVSAVSMDIWEAFSAATGKQFSSGKPPRPRGLL